MLNMLSNKWWVILLQGILALIFGIIALTFTGATALALFAWFVAYAVVSGILSLYMGFTHLGESKDAWWVVFSGLSGIALGALAFIWPGLTALVLLLFIGAYALTTGIFQIISAVQLRKEIDNEWLLAASGVVSVIFAALMFLQPLLTGFALVWVIGIWAIIWGIGLIAASIQVKGSDGSESSSMLPA